MEQPKFDYTKPARIKGSKASAKFILRDDTVIQPLRFEIIEDNGSVWREWFSESGAYVDGAESENDLENIPESELTESELTEPSKAKREKPTITGRVYFAGAADGGPEIRIHTDWEQLQAFPANLLYKDVTITLKPNQP